MLEGTSAERLSHLTFVFVFAQTNINHKETKQPSILPIFL